MINTLKSVLVSFLGPYNPVVTVLSNGDEVVQYDIEYIGACLLLIAVVWCVFRIIGGLICNK